MSLPATLLRQGEIAVLTVDNPPVNALSHAVRSAIVTSLEEAAADDEIKALVLICEGRTFFAGADITEFGKPPKDPDLRHMQAVLERLPKLTVAAIHGTALGGGLETALCCNYRVAASTAKLGLPESNLGLIPGAGGTQRLPRVVGAEKALDMMISGKPIGAKEALERGLVDELVDAPLLEAALNFAQKLVARGAPLRRTSELEVDAVDDGFFADYRSKMARRTRGFEAPERIVQAVEAALTQPFEDGMAAERRLFEECMASPQSSSMRHLFFAERAAAKVPGIGREVRPRTMEQVAVIGAGTMGAGIALACMNAGLPVTLLDNSDEGLARGRDTISKLLDAQVSKGRMPSDDMASRLALLETSQDYASLGNADMIIEAVFETMAIKEEVFGKLDAHCKPGAILATNTSTLDIDRIAASTGRPEDVIGLHFFSPANVMRLLEIVRGAATRDQVIVDSLALGKKIGKLGVVVGNCFGFVGNRMLYGYGRENQLLLLEGATPERIDAALQDWGMAMGPNAVGDLAGLDVGYKVRQERTDLPDDPRYYRVATLLAEMGRYGQKTGKGTYLYEPGSRRPIPDPEVQALIKAEAERLGVPQRDVSADEIIERCIYALVVEGAKILEEGIASRAGDIDAVWANGYGFPRYRGGPMFYADTVGLRTVYETVCRFSELYGEEYWAPPGLLRQLAETGGTFADYQPNV